MHLIHVSNVAVQMGRMKAIRLSRMDVSLVMSGPLIQRQSAKNTTMAIGRQCLAKQHISSMCESHWMSIQDLLGTNLLTFELDFTIYVRHEGVENNQPAWTLGFDQER